MSKDVKNGSVAKDLAELKKLFTPPVLTSEHLKAYYTIMERFLECLKPRDFVEQMFVKDLTDATWEIMRYSRHKTMVIEREHERHLEIQAKRRREERKRKAAIAEAIRERAAAKQAGETKAAESGEQAGAPTSQFDRWLELDEVNVVCGLGAADDATIKTMFDGVSQVLPPRTNLKKRSAAS